MPNPFALPWYAKPNEVKNYSIVEYKKELIKAFDARKIEIVQALVAHATEWSEAMKNLRENIVHYIVLWI